MFALPDAPECEKTKHSKPGSLMMRGVDALSRREYSRTELFRKLMRGLQEGETADDVETVLDELEQKGYLSNERYALARVRVRAFRYGNRRLMQELNVMGVDSETAQAALEEAGDEFERARQVWEKKFGSAPADRKERDKQIRFLAARGFGFDIIGRIICADLEE